MELPPGVREAALFPGWDLPDPPQGHPYTIVHRDGYQLGYMAGMSHGSVTVRRLDAGALETCIEDARALLAEAGYRSAAWIVADAAEPAGLAAQLREHGLDAWPESGEGLEASFSQMALAAEPPAAPAGLEAHLVETFEEYVAASAVALDAFEMSEQNRRAFEDRQAEHWEWEQRFEGYKTFAALADGEVIGAAHAIFGRTAAYLVGGSVRSDRRGRGAYRALVRARWDAAAANGTPALTVTAGSLSGPILERLGFATVGLGAVLSDRF